MTRLASGGEIPSTGSRSAEELSHDPAHADLIEHVEKMRAEEWLLGALTWGQAFVLAGGTAAGRRRATVARSTGWRRGGCVPPAESP